MDEKQEMEVSEEEVLRRVLLSDGLSFFMKKQTSVGWDQDSPEILRSQRNANFTDASIF